MLEDRWGVAELDACVHAGKEKDMSDVPDLKQSLHEMTNTELCYFMAKLVEEMTRRMVNDEPRR